MVHHRVTGVGLVALAATAEVDGEDGCGTGEPCLDETVEGVRVRRQAVSEDQDRLGAGVLDVVKPNAVRLDVAVAHVSSPFRCRYASLISRRRVLPATFRGNEWRTKTSESFW